MEIHEITKGPQRTDEGILDGIKKAVSATKTGYAAAANIAKYAKSVGGVKSLAGAASNTMKNLGDKYQAHQWDKTQDKINKSAANSAEILRRKGFNVNPANLPQSKATTPDNVRAGTAGNQFKANVSQQSSNYNTQQLRQAFIQQFVGPPQGTPTPPTTMANAPTSVVNKANPNNPNFGGKPPVANTMANAPVAKTNTAQPGNPNIAAQTPAPAAPKPTRTGGKIAGQVSTTKDAERKRAARAAARASKLKEDGDFLTELKDIQTDFPKWIDSQMPGLSAAKQNPAIKPILDKAFNGLVAAKGDPTALTSAFDSYLSTVTQALKQSSQGQQQGAQPGAQQDGSGRPPPSQRKDLTTVLPKNIATTLQSQLKSGAISDAQLLDYIKNVRGV